MQSDTDKLIKIISYILFLRLILAIITISTIFKIATKTPVERPMLLSSFSELVAPQPLVVVWTGCMYVDMLKDDKLDMIYMFPPNCYRFSQVHSYVLDFQIIFNEPAILFVSML